jgi:hypothetical protein
MIGSRRQVLVHIQRAKKKKKFQSSHTLRYFLMLPVTVQLHRTTNNGPVPVLAFLSRIPLLRRDRDGSRELENRNSCRQWPNGSLLLVVAHQRVRFAGV